MECILTDMCTNFDRVIMWSLRAAETREFWEKTPNDITLNTGYHLTREGGLMSEVERTRALSHVERSATTNLVHALRPFTPRDFDACYAWHVRVKSLPSLSSRTRPSIALHREILPKVHTYICKMYCQTTYKLRNAKRNLWIRIEILERVSVSPL